MPNSDANVESRRAILPRESNDLYRIAWQHRNLLMLGTLAGLVLGAMLALLLAPVYQSTAQILMVKKRPDAVTGVDTRSLGAEEYIAPAQELLKSHLIIDRAVRSKQLRTLSMFAAVEGDLVETIRGGLNVTPVKSPLATSTNVFSLAFRGAGTSRLSSPDAAAATAAEEDCRVVLDAILETFKDFLDKKYQNVSSDTIELIMREKQALEREMTEKADMYRKFREHSPLLGKDGLDLRRETLAGIQAKRSTLLLRRVELEAQLTAVRTALQTGQNRTAVLAMLADFNAKADAVESGRDKSPSPQEQLYPLLLEERKLLDSHGPKHPEVLAVRGRIEAARRLLSLPTVAWSIDTRSSSGEKIVAASTEPTGVSTASLDIPADPIDLHVQLLKQKCEHIKASEEVLTKVMQSEQDETRRLSAYEIQEESLRTSVALSKAMYEALVKRLSDVSLLRNVGGYEIETMEPPALGKKVGPSTKIYAIGGALLGAMLAYVAACLVEILKNKP